MEELCQPTMLGRGGPIAPMTMQATKFGLTNHMIQQVQQSCQYHGLPGDDANNLMDALTQIPKYSKVLKDLLKDKEKLEELANTPINIERSAILLNKVPEKLGDPGKFLIPCVLQDLEVCNSFADFGASINLMPLSIYEKLGIGPLKPTRMTLELANRFVTYPIGIAEDVIVKVDKINFLADFVIVDFEADLRVPIILGRPFFRTAKALVDLYEEKLTLRIKNEELVFRAEKALRYTLKDHHSVHSIDIVNSSSSPSLAPFKTSDSILEEFVDELALIDSFPPGNDDIDFDFESDLRELEYLLNRDPSIDSSSEKNIEMIDSILEEFTNELSLVDSFLWEMMMISLNLKTIMKNGGIFYIKIHLMILP
ncbi:reverse transcriptase domain-containing protein [Tanacetum coccineum]